MAIRAHLEDMSSERMDAAQIEVDVFESVTIQMTAELGEDIVGTHVWDEPEVHFGGGFCRQNGLHALTLISRIETSDVCGGHEEMFAWEVFGAESGDERGVAERLTPLIGVVWQVGERTIFFGGRFADIVVETVDQDAIVGRVFDGVERVNERPCG